MSAALSPFILVPMSLLSLYTLSIMGSVVSCSWFLPVLQEKVSLQGPRLFSSLCPHCHQFDLLFRKTWRMCLGVGLLNLTSPGLAIKHLGSLGWGALL